MKSIVIISVFSALVALFFNNCGNLNSQQQSLSSVSGVPAPASVSQANLPVDPLNPYVLQCIVDSDGTKVSSKLLLAVQTSLSSGISGKLDSLDWSQDTDLVLTIDNDCLKKNPEPNPILKYTNADEATPELARSIFVIKKESVKNLKFFIDDALNSECLIAAEKNQIFKVKADVIDPIFSMQRHLASIGATELFLNGLPSGVNVDQVKVAVIDTGIDTANSDLTNQFARDLSGNIVGKNTTTTPGDGFLADSGFHGTHVAGLIGAQYHNGLGGSGVYGKYISLFPVRASDDGSSLTLAALASGINWAISQKVDVINMSVGATADTSLILKDAIAQAIAANVVIVVAAGNDNKELGLGATNEKVYPALYSTQFDGLITVGSFDVQSGARSWFSNYSTSYVDILAPGSDGTNGISSTVPTSVNTNGYASVRTVDGQLSPIEGTSMAAPVVTGAVAAAISITKHRFSNQQLETMLKGAGSPKSSTFAAFASGGNYLSLPVFLNYAKTQVNGTAPPPPPGSLSFSSQPVNKIAVVGESISLQVAVMVPNGGGSPNYQWFKNGLPIGTNSSVLLLSNLTQNDGGVYKVTVSSGSLASITSQNADLKIALRYCN